MSAPVPPPDPPIRWEYVDPSQPSHPRQPSTRKPRPRIYICEQCERSFDRPFALAQHMLTHSGKRPHNCTNPWCSATFTTKSNAVRHTRYCVPPVTSSIPQKSQQQQQQQPDGQPRPTIEAPRNRSVDYIAPGREGTEQAPLGQLPESSFVDHIPTTSFRAYNQTYGGSFGPSTEQDLDIGTSSQSTSRAPLSPAVPLPSSVSHSMRSHYLSTTPSDTTPSLEDGRIAYHEPTSPWSTYTPLAEEESLLYLGTGRLSSPPQRSLSAPSTSTSSIPHHQNPPREDDNQSTYYSPMDDYQRHAASMAAGHPFPESTSYWSTQPSNSAPAPIRNAEPSYRSHDGPFVGQAVGGPPNDDASIQWQPSQMQTDIEGPVNEPDVGSIFPGSEFAGQGSMFQNRFHSDHGA